MVGKEANHPSPEGLDCLPLAREPTTLPTRVKSLSRHKPPSTPTAKRQNKKPKSNIMFDLGSSWRAKNEAPILVVGALIFAGNERILTPLCDSQSRRMGFAYPTRRSKSSLFRRRVWVSSPKVNTPLPSLLYMLTYMLTMLEEYCFLF